MLTVEQLDMLARGVSTGAGPLAGGPMWRNDEQVIYLGSPGGNLDYWQVGLEGGPPATVTGGIKPFFMDWVGEARVSPDGKWLGYVSGAPEGREGLEVWLRPLEEDGEPFCLTRFGVGISSFGWSPDGKWVAVSSNRYGSPDIYLVSVPEGRTRRLTDGELFEVSPAFSADSARIFYVRADDTWLDHEIISVDLDGSNETSIAEDTNFFGSSALGYPLVDPKGRWIVFRSYRSGWVNYWKVDAQGNGSPQPVVGAEADQTEGSWSPDGNAFTYLENHRGNIQLRVLKLDSGEVTVLDGDGFGVCSGPSWSPDSSRLAYIYQALDQPAELRVVDLSDNDDGRITVQSRRVLAGPEEPDLVQQLVTPERVRYETFDGRMIDAFLYLPPGNLEGPHPAIVLVHGGPTAQFSETYEHQGTFTSAQYLAQQGYVLLLPNVRGSSGYGREFADLNRSDWGRGDVEDVVCAVNYLKSMEAVDSDAIGIYGSSYGGSLVMSTITFRPGVFHAAVSRSGYSDWLLSYKECAEHGIASIKSLHYQLGPMPQSAHIYRRSSPYYEVERIRTPVMVINGEGRPPRSTDAPRLVEEMRRFSKPVRHKVYENEGYYVRSVHGRRQVLLDVVDFFHKFLREPIKL